MNLPPSLLDRWMVGFGRLWESESRLLAYVLAAYVTFALIERAIPAERGQSWRGKGRNLIFLAIYMSVGLGALSLWYTLNPVGRSSDFARIESLLYLPAYLFATDIAYYWYHRAQHRFPTLWAIHELHHADAELNVTTSYRTYWLEAPMQSILLGAPVLAIFGAPGARFALIAVFITRFVLLFAHSNLRVPLGLLTPVVVGPQLHRIHHSRLPEHQDTNFAQLFPVIDIVFGTYRAPGTNEYPPTGTPELKSDAPIWRTQVQPFAIWREQLVSGLKRITGIGRATR